MEILKHLKSLILCSIFIIAGCEFTDNLLGSRPSIDDDHLPSNSETAPDEPFTSFQSELLYTGSDQVVQVPNGATKLTVKMWGAGGGGGRSYSGVRNYGGAGAYTEASFNVSDFPSSNLIAVVGFGGLSYLHLNVQISNYLGGGPSGSGSCNNGRSSSGGGLVGLFVDSISQANALIVTGSAGGSSSSNGSFGTTRTSRGGAGGTVNIASTAGTNSFQSGAVKGGGAGTAINGGVSGAPNGLAGLSLAGGAGGPSAGGTCGGGGGAGYFGGGGGGNSSAFNDTPGGGGSGYAAASALIIYEEVSANLLAPNTADADYPGSPIGEGGDIDSDGGNGHIVLIWE